MKRKTSSSPRIALALAGGGPPEAIYEIGALCALDESLKGIDFTRLQHHVGVAPGGFMAAGLATDIIPIEPDQRDPEPCPAHPFSHAQPHPVAEPARQPTRQLLRVRKTGPRAWLARRRITLRNKLDERGRVPTSAIHRRSPPW